MLQLVSRRYLQYDVAVSQLFLGSRKHLRNGLVTREICGGYLADTETTYCFQREGNLAVRRYRRVAAREDHFQFIFRKLARESCFDRFFGYVRKFSRFIV